MYFIDYIGANFGQGAGIAGCECAPKHLRALGIIQKITQLGVSVNDCGDIYSAPMLYSKNNITNGIRNFAVF